MNDFPLALDVSNLLHWLPVLLVLSIVLNGVRLRRHLSGLAMLVPSDELVDPSHRFVIAEGVMLDQATRRAASAFARREGLEVVDLIPADLPIDRALGLGRMVDTRTFRADRLAPGQGAFQAMLADVAILERAGVTKLEGLDPFEIARVMTYLKRYASASTDLAVAPALRATPNEPEKRLAFLRALFSSAAMDALAFPFAEYVALGIGVIVNPAWGAVALVVFSVQPYLALAGGVPITPRDLHRSASTSGRHAPPARWRRPGSALRQVPQPVAAPPGPGGLQVPMGRVLAAARAHHAA